MDTLIFGQSKNGKAVFANKDFIKDEFIIKFRGKFYTSKDKVRGLTAKNNHFLQIDKDLYLGPTRTLDNYINHSCNSNSGLKISDKVLLFAIRNIKKGEEITFDYSTTMDADGWEMDCMCESKNCRKRIRDFKYLPKKIQQKYIRLGIVPKYIIEK